MRTRDCISVLILAVVATVLNAFKPLHIDDTMYHDTASQAAKNPLEPYSFLIMEFPEPYHGNECIAPPVVPYWWSLAIRLFGERPFLWKLWLLPFNLIFAVSLYHLCRRFARGLEMPLVWMTVLSPTFLPSINLMFDVPGLALALFALTLFMRACDGQTSTTASYCLAALAGLVAGLAIQTKYTGFLVLATMLVYALTHARLRLWPVAAAVAGVLFVSWEVYTAELYGRSHFLFGVDYFSEPIRGKKRLALPGLIVLGGVAPAIALLALASLGTRRWIILVVGLTAVLGYLVVAVGINVSLSLLTVLSAVALAGALLALAGWSGHRRVAVAARLIAPFALAVLVIDDFFNLSPLLILGPLVPIGVLTALAALGVHRGIVLGIGLVLALGFALIAQNEPALEAVLTLDQKLSAILDPWIRWRVGTPDHLIFCGLGLVVFAPAVLLAWRLCRLPWRRGWQWYRWDSYRGLRFLVLWLAVEVLGYFAISPFPAVRRVMGLAVVTTLLAGHLAAWTCRSRQRMALVRGIMAFGIVLGLGFYTIDLLDARAQKEATEAAARLIRERDGGTVWFVGHWGFRYYAERGGFQPFLPRDPLREARLPYAESSKFRAGDWLVLGGTRVDLQNLGIPEDQTEAVVWLYVDDFVPLTTVMCFYHGVSPLEHKQGPRQQVEIRRITADFTAAAR